MSSGTLNTFDKAQIDRLGSLIHLRTVLHFTFFPNSFPIAYHYACALSRAGLNVDEHIREFTWGSEPTELVERCQGERLKTPHFFYLTREDFTYVRRRLGGQCYLVPFTTYAPRFAFLNNNAFTRGLVDIEKCDLSRWIHKDLSTLKKEIDNLMTLDKLLDAVVKNGIERFALYSDTPNEAMWYWRQTGERNFLLCDASNIGSLAFGDECENTSNTLDVYIYGASESFYFLSNPGRYIPLRLSERVDTFKRETVGCIYTPNDTQVGNLVQELADYHTELFKLCNDSQKGPTDLNNVRLGYNKYAKLTQNNTTFHKPQRFVNCIALHHLEGEDKT